MEDIPQYPGYGPSKQCDQNCIYNAFHFIHSPGLHTQISQNRLYPLQKLTGKFMRLVIHNHKHFIMIITKEREVQVQQKAKDRTQNIVFERTSLFLFAYTKKNGYLCSSKERLLFPVLTYRICFSKQDNIFENNSTK